jgi:hypothetical protein
MFLRVSLQAGTALAVIAALAVSVSSAFAADIYVPADAPSSFAPPAAQKPAVDGINGSLSALGGGGDSDGIFGLVGKLSIPVGHAFGTQFDGGVFSNDGNTYFSVANHTFWRDPDVGLAGVYGSFSHYDAAGGLNGGRVGAEGEAYLGRFTIRGVAGVEFSNGDSSTSGSTLTSYDDGTRFFDMVDFAYYPTDNISVYAGHRYTGGNHALALGTEVLFQNGSGTAFSAFAEGRIGESDHQSAWVGVRAYFGQSDKSLIRRHREDDPNTWEPDTLFGIANSLGQTPVDKIPDIKPPPEPG